mgnify:CR=1 FL=1
MIRIENLHKNFGGVRAVDDASLQINEGAITGLIGPNGAGKTTYVGLLSGRIPASAGSVTFDGQNITHLPAHQRIRAGMAYTFQITSIYGRLSVQENVALALRWRTGGNEAATTERASDALERVGIAERADQLAGDLSYGHQRLLEIAMGISQQPRLLILDEPTQGLADSEIVDFISLIRGLAGEMTILLIEHNINVVMQTANEITVLNGGEILAEGTPSEIRENAAVQAAYLGTG